MILPIVCNVSVLCPRFGSDLLIFTSVFFWQLRLQMGKVSLWTHLNGLPGMDY